MAMRRPRKRQKDSRPMEAGLVLNAVLEALGGPELLQARARLSLLWQNWAMVMGPDLSSMARPLGHHKDLLLIGAEDAMLAQELHLLSGEVLERVNAFMESPFFSAVKVTLLMGKPGLDHEQSGQVQMSPGGFGEASATKKRSCAQGAFLQAMDPASPVAKAYALFVAKAATEDNENI